VSNTKRAATLALIIPFLTRLEKKFTVHSHQHSMKRTADQLDDGTDTAKRLKLLAEPLQIPEPNLGQLQTALAEDMSRLYEITPNKTQLPVLRLVLDYLVETGKPSDLKTLTQVSKSLDSFRRHVLFMHTHNLRITCMGRMPPQNHGIFYHTCMLFAPNLADFNLPAIFDAALVPRDLSHSIDVTYYNCKYRQLTSLLLYAPAEVIRCFIARLELSRKCSNRPDYENLELDLLGAMLRVLHKYPIDFTRLQWPRELQIFLETAGIPKNFMTANAAWRMFGHQWVCDTMLVFEDFIAFFTEQWGFSKRIQQQVYPYLLQYLRHCFSNGLMIDRDRRKICISILECKAGQFLE